ncbi:NAD(P)H-binding protein [Asanoa sp. NPDC050611]|uniref:SDR family oxidoreductase n=1 Tax=Asanoa sp. NPDC050611 TaxID=3157098 RepID=UPI0033CC5667
MRIAVTGGTGRIGGRVVELLAEDGRHDVVALSSRTAPYDDRAALRAAFEGVHTLVFVSSDGEAARVVTHHRNVLAAAGGVAHIVQLSGLDVAMESPFCYAFTNGDTERLLRAGDRPYSIVRTGLFTEFFLSLVRQVAVDGTVALPAGSARVSLVSREDVARGLAALALGEPVNGHRDVTGPESPTVAEVVEAAGYAYAECTSAELIATLARLGEEPWWIYAYTSMFESISQGRWAGVAPVTDGTPA